jgi:hypothetical protein
MNTIRLTGAGWSLFVAILVFVPVTASSPAQDPPPTNSKHNEPSIIVAEHVLLWDNQIVTWDDFSPGRR